MVQIFAYPSILPAPFPIPIQSEPRMLSLWCARRRLPRSAEEVERPLAPKEADVSFFGARARAAAADVIYARPLRCHFAGADCQQLPGVARSKGPEIGGSLVWASRRRGFGRSVRESCVAVRGGRGGVAEACLLGGSGPFAQVSAIPEAPLISVKAAETCAPRRSSGRPTSSGAARLTLV